MLDYIRNVRHVNGSRSSLFFNIYINVKKQKNKNKKQIETNTEKAPDSLPVTGMTI